MALVHRAVEAGGRRQGSDAPCRIHQIAADLSSC